MPQPLPTQKPIAQSDHEDSRNGSSQPGWSCGTLGGVLFTAGVQRRPALNADVLTSQISSDGVAVVTLDDGKVNAISPAVIAAFSKALDSIEADSRANAMVLAGREGQFSAGFDLATIMAGGTTRNELVSGGWELLLRLVEFPHPLVIACTGNAVAAGAALLLTGDIRLGADGDFKVGFNEVGIGLPLPGTVAALAEARLTAAEVFAATAGARLYTPHEAIRAGYFHDVAPPTGLIDRAVEHAAVLGRLPQGSFATTKQIISQATVAAMRGHISGDRALLERIGG